MSKIPDQIELQRRLIQSLQDRLKARPVITTVDYQPQLIKGHTGQYWNEQYEVEYRTNTSNLKTICELQKEVRALKLKDNPVLGEAQGGPGMIQVIRVHDNSAYLGRRSQLEGRWFRGTLHGDTHKYISLVHKEDNISSINVAEYKVWEEPKLDGLTAAEWKVRALAAESKLPLEAFRIGDQVLIKEVAAGSHVAYQGKLGTITALMGASLTFPGFQEYKIQTEKGLIWIAARLGLQTYQPQHSERVLVLATKTPNNLAGKEVQVTYLYNQGKVQDGWIEMEVMYGSQYKIIWAKVAPIQQLDFNSPYRFDREPTYQDLPTSTRDQGQIGLIKQIREITGWGLKEAKEFSEGKYSSYSMRDSQTAAQQERLKRLAAQYGIRLVN